MFNINYSVRGEFDVHIAKMDADDNEISRREVLRNCKNLVTNTGMIALGTTNINSWTNALQVGTSNTAPTYTDTSLGARVAGVTAAPLGGAGVSSEGVSRDPINPRVVIWTRVFTFGTGVAAGVLSELGLAASTTGNIYTHALFTDEEGDPVTVTVLADEQLIVTYRTIFIASENDSTLVITQKGTEYTLTLRPAFIEGPFRASNQHIGNALLGSMAISGSGERVISYRGVTSGIGAITEGPTGTAFVVATNSSASPTFSYSSPNHYRDETQNVALTVSSYNDQGAFLFEGTPFRLQLGASPRINKTNDDTMSFTIRVSWSRE